MLSKACNQECSTRKQEPMKPSRSKAPSPTEIRSDSLAKTQQPTNPQTAPTALPRREFFRIGGITAAASLGLPALLKPCSASASDATSAASQRRSRAYQTRQQAAMAHMQQAVPDRKSVV